MLVTAFGISAEAYPVVLSASLCGLGLGSVAAAFLKRHPRHNLRILILCEIGIAILSLISQSFITALGHVRMLDTVPAMALAAFGFVLLATAPMGVALGLMHTSFSLRTSVATAFAAYLLGASAAAAAVVHVIFVQSTLHTAIALGAGLSIAIALACAAIYAIPVVPNSAEIENRLFTQSQQPFSSAVLPALVMGYLAASYLLLWYRLLDFLTMEKPSLFGLLTASYLGIAALAPLIVVRLRSNILRNYIFGALVILQFAWYGAFPFMIKLAGRRGAETGQQLGLCSLALLGVLLAGLLQWLCQSVRPSPAPRCVSLLAVAAFGAAAGSLCSGWWLLDRYTLPQTILITGFATTALVLLLLIGSGIERKFKYHLLAFCLAAAFAGYQCYNDGYKLYLEKLQKAGSRPGVPFDFTQADHNGVIAVKAGQVFENGADKGKFNIDPDLRNSEIWRAYAIATLHPLPKKILQIGLGSGAFTAAMSNFQPLKSLTVLENNPLYIDMLRATGDQNSILDRAKVDVIITSPRHWLTTHTEEKFDLIVMDGPDSERNNATNVLSQEFFSICKHHLKSGGMIYINNPPTPDISFTLAQIFNNVAIYNHMLVAGNTESDVPLETKIDHLQQFTYPRGAPVYDDNEKIQGMAHMTYTDQKHAVEKRQGMVIITDGNMATEFKK